MKHFKQILTVIVMMLLLALGFWIRGCVDIDRCLDRGGRWNYDKDTCEYSGTEEQGR